MFRNYCKVAIRSLWRFKTFSFINLFGLAIGMIVCLTVVIFVRYETGYDRQYAQNIYRLCEVQQQEQDAVPAKIAQTRFPVALVESISDNQCKRKTAITSSVLSDIV